MENKKVMLKFRVPLAEIIADFFDKLKSLTKGYASMDFEFSGYEEADIRKLTICIMGDPIDALSFLVHKDKAEKMGRKIVHNLKNKIPR